MKKALIIIGILGLVTFLIFAQEPVAISREEISLFPEDTCKAPCWFGLIAGESTSTDVENMLEQQTEIMEFHRSHDDASISENALVLNGWYEIFWPFVYTPMLIRIENGLVYYIKAMPRYLHQVRISDALSIYGQPNYILIYSQSYGDFYLVYTDYRIVINFRTDFMDEVPSTGVLDIDYEFAEVIYYSPQKAIDSTEHYSPDNIDLYLNPVEAANVRQVPLEIWQDWLIREDVRPFGESEWNRLPTTIEIPIHPTLIPTAIP